MHATIAGVALGALTPARSSGREPVLERLEHVLRPWTGAAVVPLFALANSGVFLGPSALADAASSGVTRGVVLGLVVGKLAGISLAVAVSVKLSLGRLPADVTLSQVVGAAALSGIGFTVSLFVAGLAFDGAPLADAKIGILVGSVLAGSIGTLALARSRGRLNPAPVSAD